MVTRRGRREGAWEDTRRRRREGGGEAGTHGTCVSPPPPRASRTPAGAAVGSEHPAGTAFPRPDTACGRAGGGGVRSHAGAPLPMLRTSIFPGAPLCRGLNGWGGGGAHLTNFPHHSRRDSSADSFAPPLPLLARTPTARPRPASASQLQWNWGEPPGGAAVAVAAPCREAARMRASPPPCLCLPHLPPPALAVSCTGGAGALTARRGGGPAGPNPPPPPALPPPRRRPTLRDAVVPAGEAQ